MQAQTDLFALSHALVKAHHDFEAKLADHDKGLVSAETLLLANLTEWPSRTPSDFVKLTGLTKGRITHLLDRLEDKKLVERTEDPRDKRKTRVVLTASGNVLAKDCKTKVDEFYRTLTENLGQAGTDMLVEQLGKI